MPVMKPAMSDRNLTPTSRELLSPSSFPVTDGPKIEQGQVTGAVPSVTVTPAPGVSRFRLSSTARLLIVAVPVEGAVQANDQLARPVAGRQVVPPSTEIST